MKEKPDCNKCRVEIDPLNMVNIALYSMVRGQRVGTAMGSIGELSTIALDHIINKFEEEYGIEDVNETFKEILFFSREVDRHILIGMKNKREAKKD